MKAQSSFPAVLSPSKPTHRKGFGKQAYDEALDVLKRLHETRPQRPISLKVTGRQFIRLLEQFDGDEDQRFEHYLIHSIHSEAHHDLGGQDGHIMPQIPHFLFGACLLPFTTESCLSFRLSLLSLSLVYQAWKEIV